MTIDELNALDADAAATALRPCADIDSFVSALVAGRPYTGKADLVRLAEAQLAHWSDDEVDRALRDHPRIGERPQGRGTSAAMSQSEQAGVDASDTEVRDRLADGNRRYEERFGRIYLVRAKGRSSEELLTLLEQRLSNDDIAEAAIVKQQLGEIALLRLTALIEEDA